ncbi:hypothetical protein IFR23_12830 [Sphingomonas sp. CFBP 13603]|uniref:hypothetical protein n=1 Tax=Sphingomonas sp. CFBP 13603 TaxID=2774040 RepID=UPI001867FD62|nr:hypothetical protein [Sphingomonas sp. CFBP 13603]MBE2992897.1 hypothetical protein [Sphingomonas sp. CFBP 13603]
MTTTDRRAVNGAAICDLPFADGIRIVVHLIRVRDDSGLDQGWKRTERRKALWRRDNRFPALPGLAIFRRRSARTPWTFVSQHDKYRRRGRWLETV